MASNGIRARERLRDHPSAVPLAVQLMAQAQDRASAPDEIRALINATFDVIATKESFDPQVRDILSRSGLSRQVLYRHFESKDELLLVVLDESWRMLAAYLNKRIARTEGAEARLRAWISGIMRQAEDPEASRRTRPFAMMGSRLEARFPDEYAEARRAFVGSLARVIADGVEQGAFESRHPEKDALIIHDAVFLRQNRHLVLRTHPSRTEVEDLSQFAIRALAPSWRP